MKKTIFLFAFLIGFVPLTFSQVKWEADPAHSNVHFSVNHLGISFVDGEFRKMNGTVETKAEKNWEDAVFNFTIDVNSIDTRVQQRDDHLKSDDFFNAEKYPQITLTNGKLKKIKDGKYQLKGNLTMRNITKPVTFDVTFRGVITDPWGGTRAGLTATTEVDRTVFNIKYDNKLPSGVDEVGKKVKIEVNTELVKK